jgi:hypothetical protein
MKSRRASIEKALWQAIILIVAILGLTLSPADSARGWAASSEREPSSVFAADSSPGVPAMSEIGLSLGFTMADFTGDTHPDLATVELNGFDSASALYVIDVQFSEGGRQLLRMKAPLGGLFITAKDVTGDGNLDLVISAARSGNPLTVFLNDGHGHFTAAEPSAFASILPDTSPGQKIATERFYFRATLISRRFNAIRRQNRAARDSDVQNASLVSANHRVPLHPFLPFGLDRAPPITA